MGFRPVRELFGGVLRVCRGCSGPVPGFAGILARALSDTSFIHTKGGQRVTGSRFLCIKLKTEYGSRFYFFVFCIFCA